MKIILSSKRNHYVGKFGIFLVTVALIAGMVGCAGGVVEYDLTIASTAGGSVTEPGEGVFTYEEGRVVNLVAEADDGYEFVNWTGDVGTVTDVNDPTTAIIMNGDRSITANFAVAIYDLTISSTAGGSVTDPGEGTFPYYGGTVVDLTAEADEGYRFVEWTGDVGTVANGTAAATNITMSGDYSITANFAWQYNLSINSTGGGNVTTPGEGTFTYDEGTVVNLVATPDLDYRFVSWTGDAGTVGNATAAATTITVNADYCITANFEAKFMVAAGGYHTVGLCSDGTAVGVGYNTDGRCDVGSWTDIAQVAAGNAYTVGLKSDGTVVAVGDNLFGQCDVGNWMDIVQVTTGGGHTVGLKSDGTVVAVGWNNDGQCDVGSWTDMIQVGAGEYHTVGLKSDGTVVTVGGNTYGQCNIGGWTDIAQVAAGGYHTVGVKADKTVVAVGRNTEGQCNVGGWTDIIQVGAGLSHTVGVKADGTAIATGWNLDGQCNVSGWTDTIQVDAGHRHTVGVKADGTVVAVGDNTYEQCNVGDWDLN